jgi:hypothetical protein
VWQPMRCRSIMKYHETGFLIAFVILQLFQTENLLFRLV